MKVLAIIPARKGSKGIPGKNMALLNGKPLIEYTIEAAKGSKLIDRIIISTDDEKLAEYALTQKIEIPFLRPQEIAQDHTPMIDVVLHAIRFLSDTENYTPDALLLLQPTSPFRTNNHIDDAIAKYSSANYESIVSVVELPHNFNPESIYLIENEFLVPFTKKKKESIYNRHFKPKYYARNGPAILITKINFLLSEKAFYSKKNGFYLMSQLTSIDIDTPEDLKVAEAIINIYNLK